MKEGGLLANQLKESPSIDDNSITKLLDRKVKLSNSLAGGISSNSYLQVNLKYFQNIPAIRGIQQISRPGNRTYMNIKRILQYSSEQN